MLGGLEMLSGGVCSGPDFRGTGAAAADVVFTMVEGSVLYERGGIWNLKVDPAEVAQRGIHIRGKLRD